MAVGVSNGPGQDTVVQRGTSFLEVRYNVTGSDYDPLVWLINPDLAPVAGVPNWYWKTVGDTVQEQDVAEKAATDAQIALNDRTVPVPLVPSRPVNVSVLTKFLTNQGYSVDVVTVVADPVDAALTAQVNVRLTAVPTSDQRANLVVYIGNTYSRPPAYANPAGRSPDGVLWKMAPDNAGVIVTTPIP